MASSDPGSIIAGHNNCELRRHLDSVPLELPYSHRYCGLVPGVGESCRFGRSAGQ